MTVSDMLEIRTHYWLHCTQLLNEVSAFLML